MPNLIPSQTRRLFCYGAASALLLRPGPFALSQALPSVPATPTRPDVAAIDHDRILAAAERYLAIPPTPITSMQSPRSPGTVHDYYSEAEANPDADPAPKAPAPAPFLAHRDAVFQLGLAVPALAAAYLLTGEARYADHAALHLRAWFVHPATRMNPSLNYGQVMPHADAPSPGVQTNASFGADLAPVAGGRFQGIIETVPLVEVAQSIPFLAASTSLSPTELAAVHAWFAGYLHWLTAPEDSGPRLAALARDQKDHHASSWLLQTSAYACLAVPSGDVAKAEDSALAELRKRFRSVTLRAQISRDGTFPHELASSNPYRDSLFNLDMMAGICQLLSTRFESVWDYQLEDGPSMRSAIAFHFRYMADKSTWPFRADAHRFDQLPGRRASLLFTARAYQRPEYAALWKTLPPDPAAPEILRTLPIQQPLLWVRQPARPASSA